MLKKNHVITGMLAGAVLPGITWFIFWYILNNKVIFNNKPLIPYLVALGLNLFATKFLFKKGYDQTGTGVMLISFVVVILLGTFQNYLR